MTSGRYMCQIRRVTISARSVIHPEWWTRTVADAQERVSGGRSAFGEVVDPVYHLDKADVILSLEADFLACGSPGRVADERAYSARRTPKEGVMNRLYVAEAAYTNTGASADHPVALDTPEGAYLKAAWLRVGEASG